MPPADAADATDAAVADAADAAVAVDAAAARRRRRRRRRRADRDDRVRPLAAAAVRGDRAAHRVSVLGRCASIKCQLNANQMSINVSKQRLQTAILMII